MSKNILKLHAKDIGKTVWYVPNHAKDNLSEWECGKIKSFNNDNKIAWVVYDKGDSAMVHHYQEYTAASTRYEDLRWSKS